MMDNNMMKKAVYFSLVAYTAAHFIGCAKEPKQQDISDQVQAPKEGEKIKKSEKPVKGSEKPLEDISQIAKKAYSLYINNELSEAKEWGVKDEPSIMLRHIEEAEDAAIKSGEDISEKLKEVYKTFMDARLSDAEKYAKEGHSYFVSRHAEDAEDAAEKAGLDISERVNNIYKIYINNKLSIIEEYAKKGDRSIINGLIINLEEFFAEHNLKKDISEDIKRIRGILDSNPEVELGYLRAKKKKQIYDIYTLAEEGNDIFEYSLEDLEKLEAKILALEKKIGKKK